MAGGRARQRALGGFGTDATHGWERTQLDVLRALGTLLFHYALSEPAFARDSEELGPLNGFSTLRDQMEG